MQQVLLSCFSFCLLFLLLVQLFFGVDINDMSRDARALQDIGGSHDETAGREDWLAGPRLSRWSRDRSMGNQM
jgi:hypothetical protein